MFGLNVSITVVAPCGCLMACMTTVKRHPTI